MDFNISHFIGSWEMTAGRWEKTIEIPYCGPCISLSMEVRWNVPTCLRYRNPEVLKDGRLIAGIIEEEGTPGEPGWVWYFYLTEPVEGSVTWKIETIDVCQKVS